VNLNSCVLLEKPTIPEVGAKRKLGLLARHALWRNIVVRYGTW